jgi:hypothetical protein
MRGEDGVGDDIHSAWGYDGVRQKKWNKKGQRLHTHHNSATKGYPGRAAARQCSDYDRTGADPGRDRTTMEGWRRRCRICSNICNQPRAKIDISFTLNEYLGRPMEPEHLAHHLSILAPAARSRTEPAGKTGGAAPWKASGGGGNSMQALQPLSVGAKAGLFPAISLSGERSLLNLRPASPSIARLRTPAVLRLRERTYSISSRGRTSASATAAAEQERRH